MTRERKEIDSRFKWDLSKIYDSKESLEKDFELVKGYLKEIKKYEGKLSESADNLYSALKLMEDSSRTVSKIICFTNMTLHEDTRINENQAETQKADMLSTDVSIATSFIVPEILSIDDKKLAEFMKEDKLKVYTRFVNDILRNKPHVLSHAEEQILAATSDLASNPESTYEMLVFGDFQFPELLDENDKKVRLDHFNYSSFIRSKNRRVRKDAFEAEFSTYDKFRNTCASTLYGAIKYEIFYSKLRKHKSALEGSLFEDNIDVEVYENLIDSVHENIKHMDKYLDLKKKFLGLDELHMYDLYVPLASDFDMKITYEEAQEIVKEALKPLGEEYGKIIQRAFDERWIDVYENAGKKGGAYSWGCYDSHPYILMSYTNDLSSLFTLIHELGHSVHSYYSRTNQPYIDSEYKIFVAEVASTVNETLLINYLLEKSTDKKEKVYLLNYYLEQFRTTVFRQTLFAEFEKIAHERVEAGEPLTADDFSQIYYDLNKKYYGTNAVVDKLYEIEWARIPHFYSNFYVYKYATGFSAASALVARMLKEGDKATQNYLDFLKTGGSKFPLDELRDAGVDMSKKESVDSALNIFAELVEKLEKEL